jgi:hypothetical protein
MEKKRKRGSRGGSSKKKEEEFNDELETINDELEATTNQIESTQEEPKGKKTRRGRKGKETFYVDTVGEEAIHEQDIQFVGGEQLDKETLPTLDFDTRNYLQEIEVKLNNLDIEDEDQILFIQSIHRELKGKEWIIMTDFEASRIVEKILKVSFDYQTKRFANRLMGQFEQLFMDQFGSHVCQTVLNLAADIIEREMKGINDGSAHLDEEEEEKDTVNQKKKLIFFRRVRCSNWSWIW